MVFTQTEKYIAKQVFKITLIIIVLLIAIIFLLSGLDDFNNGEENVLQNDIKNNIIDKKVEHTEEEIKDFKLPLSLEIPDNNIYTNIQSPDSTDVKILDNALTKGSVYYPGSGFPGYNNMLIFGHSTSFKVVKNKAYQTFNNLRYVKEGTLIYVKTEDKTHIYKTVSVKKVSKYTSWIKFKSDKAMITLSTCDSFGKRSDRWVLEGEYVGVR